MTKIGFRIGKRDVAEDPERVRAVDRRRLDELLRHLREARVDRDRDERDRAPDDDRPDHGKALERVDEPVVVVEVLEPEVGERPVGDAELVVDHPVPDVHRDDRRHRPDEDEPGRDEEAHEAAELCEQQRDQRPEHHRQPDRDPGEHDGAQEHRPELAVVEDLRVVVEADPLALVRDQLEEAVLLERERDELVERVPEHRRRSRGAPARAARTAPERGPPGAWTDDEPALRPARSGGRSRSSLRVGSLRACVEDLGDPSACRLRERVRLARVAQDVAEHALEHVRALDVRPVGGRRDEPARGSPPGRTARASASSCGSWPGDVVLGITPPLTAIVAHVAACS